ncbi:CoA ester lyase [Rhabdaerophilum sp. SD176]|uniref:HpcH/HpaI aldolase/citrate lyase family protein n=1 Tax=Rhabdaerophilum sp. SD176 TaxID=2983548 RepID=UPI0024E01305|nr:CoA ester lyase [Rhabdaerophilum sp. SD176]
MRSLLFIPGDDPKKIAKGLGSGADALILDLEDSVAASRKVEARNVVRETLLARQPGQPRLVVRVNALRSGDIAADLDGVMPGAPEAIMLPKCEGGADIQHLGALVAVREAENNLPDGGTRIIAIATETPIALFRLGTIPGASQRLEGLTWGAEDLAGAIGAERNRDESGLYTEPFRLARSLALFAAAAADVTPIDTVSVDFRNMEALRAECLAARQDGFTAKMAIHPAQVPVINEVFTPDAAAIAWAQKIESYFIEHPDAGVVGIDGQMIDKPHRVQAARILARARAAGVLG